MRKIKKKRADILLCEAGICKDTDEAAKLIIAGRIRTGPDALVHKASEMLDDDTEFIIEEVFPYVSRGACKLAPALDRYLPSLDGLVALDIGASTGGFTDLMLQRGALRVYAVDSGRGQLHSKLRSDPRVISFEKVNARYLEADFLPEKIDVLTMDVSFISVTKILPRMKAFLKDTALAFVLVKPQFEVPRELVEKGGVIRNPEVRRDCVRKVADFAVRELSWTELDVIESPLPGPKGNIEFVTVFHC